MTGVVDVVVTYAIEHLPEGEAEKDLAKRCFQLPLKVPGFQCLDQLIHLLMDRRQLLKVGLSLFRRLTYLGSVLDFLDIEDVLPSESPIHLLHPVGAMVHYLPYGMPLPNRLGLRLLGIQSLEGSHQKWGMPCSMGGRGAEGVL